MATKVDFDRSSIRAVKNRLGKQAARNLRRQIDEDIEQGITDMAETSYEYAPVDTGALRSSILASVQREGIMEYIYGSHLPYAQRQEYEHEGNRRGDGPRKGFFRRSIREHRADLRKKIQMTVKHRLSGRRGFK